MSVLVTFAAFLTLLVAPAVTVGAILDLVDADDAARDWALGVRQISLPAESPDADRIPALRAARAEVLVS